MIRLGRGKSHKDTTEKRFYSMVKNTMMLSLGIFAKNLKVAFLPRTV
jgi:hypothetical protein